jgi:hypothetical protein
MPEQLLIDHCSPTLAGLKTANMFQVSLEAGESIQDELRKLNRLLREKGIRVVMLRRTDKKALIYLYRPERLKRDLGNQEAVRILAGKGYVCDSCAHCLSQLIWHMTSDESFPHEVGLFLGYPPEDVKGFMEDARRGVKCAGCWKVYGNEEEAVKTFSRYKKCTDIYRKELSKGRSLLQLTVKTGRAG